MCPKSKLFFGACKKQQDPAPQISSDYWGDASAQINGKLWTAHPVCWIDVIDHKTITIQLDSFYNITQLAEDLFFAHIPPKPGTYKVSRVVYNPNAPDALSSALGYDILETANINEIVVESYDTLSKEIRGTFDVTFIVSGRPYPNSPDTLRLQDGKFHGKLIKK
jgi:hypothetical protein